MMHRAADKIRKTMIVANGAHDFWSDTFHDFHKIFGAIYQDSHDAAEKLLWAYLRNPKHCRTIVQTKPEAFGPLLRPIAITNRQQFWRYLLKHHYPTLPSAAQELKRITRAAHALNELRLQNPQAYRDVSADLEARSKEAHESLMRLFAEAARQNPTSDPAEKSKPKPRYSHKP